MVSSLFCESKQDLYRLKYTTFNFTLSRNKRITNIEKYNNCKKRLLQCVCYWCNFFRYMFLIPCDNWTTVFFIKLYRYPGFSFNCYVLAFFETSNLIDVRIFLVFLSTTVIPKSKYNANTKVLKRSSHSSLCKKCLMFLYKQCFFMFFFKLGISL